jgi:hypothetical protein
MLRQKARDVSHILPLWEVTIQNKEIDMFHSIHPLPFVAILAVAMGPRAPPPWVQLGGCKWMSSRTVCDHALGVALIPQTGWQLVPRSLAASRSRLVRSTSARSGLQCAPARWAGRDNERFT